MARNLIRSDPFSDLARFDPFRFDPFSNINDVIRDLSLLPSLRSYESEARIKMDVEETDQNYVVKADIPGVKKEDIKVAIEGNTVSIQAQSAEEKEEKVAGNLVRRERFVGQQYRSFTLPQEIDDKGAEAQYENGVLCLSLPKKSGAISKTLAIK
jgi:HSP20 family protein